MQIEIYNPAQGEPLPPVQWNYDTLKSQLSEALESYKGRVYTEADVSVAKKDRAALNKLAEAIDAKRREMKALYLKPYEEFEAQAKELTAMVKAQASEIDTQVKAYDENRKKEKMQKCKELYASMIGNLKELLPYERIHSPKWLNVTFSVAAISEEIARAIDKVTAGLSSIDKLNLEPDIAEQVKRVFLKDFDLAAALAEKERIEKQRAELTRYHEKQEADKAAREVKKAEAAFHAEPDAANEPEVDSVSAPAEHAEQRYTIAFKVIEATSDQLAALRSFLKTNNIKYGRVN